MVQTVRISANSGQPKESKNIVHRSQESVIKIHILLIFQIGAHQQSEIL